MITAEILAAAKNAFNEESNVWTIVERPYVGETYVTVHDCRRDNLMCPNPRVAFEHHRFGSTEDAKTFVRDRAWKAALKAAIEKHSEPLQLTEEEIISTPQGLL